MHRFVALFAPVLFAMMIISMANAAPVENVEPVAGTHYDPINPQAQV